MLFFLQCMTAYRSFSEVPKIGTPLAVCPPNLDFQDLHFRKGIPWFLEDLTCAFAFLNCLSYPARNPKAFPVGDIIATMPERDANGSGAILGAYTVI